MESVQLLIFLDLSFPSNAENQFQYIFSRQLNII